MLINYKEGRRKKEEGRRYEYTALCKYISVQDKQGERCIGLGRSLTVPHVDEICCN